MNLFKDDPANHLTMELGLADENKRMKAFGKDLYDEASIKIREKGLKQN